MLDSGGCVGGVPGRAPGGGLPKNALAGGGPGGGPGTLGPAVRIGGGGEPRAPYSGSGSGTVWDNIFRIVLTSPGVTVAVWSTLDVERKLASDSLTLRAWYCASPGTNGNFGSYFY